MDPIYSYTPNNRLTLLDVAVSQVMTAEPFLRDYFESLNLRDPEPPIGLNPEPPIDSDPEPPIGK